MALSPGYGETPLDGDELDALLPAIREVLGDVPTKAEVYELEQALQDDVGDIGVTAAYTSTRPKTGPRICQSGQRFHRIGTA